MCCMGSDAHSAEEFRLRYGHDEVLFCKHFSSTLHLIGVLISTLLQRGALRTLWQVCMVLVLLHFRRYIVVYIFCIHCIMEGYRWHGLERHMSYKKD